MSRLRKSLSDNMIGCPVLVKVHPSFRSVGFTPLCLWKQNMSSLNMFSSGCIYHLRNSTTNSREKQHRKTYEIQNPGVWLYPWRATMHKCHPELGAGNMKSVFLGEKKTTGGLKIANSSLFVLFGDFAELKQWGNGKSRILAK